MGPKKLMKYKKGAGKGSEGKVGSRAGVENEEEGG